MMEVEQEENNLSIYFPEVEIDKYEMYSTDNVIFDYNQEDQQCIILKSVDDTETPDLNIGKFIEFFRKTSNEKNNILKAQEPQIKTETVVNNVKDDVQISKPKNTNTITRNLRSRTRQSVIINNTKENNKKLASKWNWFSLGRTCFRGMSNYYKSKFDPMLKEWTRNDDAEKLTMDQQIAEFVKIEFKFTDSFYSSPRLQNFIDCMVTILHSQNYKKNDEYIVGRDFNTVRNLLYWYSANAKRSFLSNKNYAYIFNHFYNQAGGLVVKQKSSGKSEMFKNDLAAEMEDINKLAIKTMTEL